MTIEEFNRDLRHILTRIHESTGIDFVPVELDENQRKFLYEDALCTIPVLQYVLRSYYFISEPLIKLKDYYNSPELSTIEAIVRSGEVYTGKILYPHLLIHKLREGNSPNNATKWSLLLSLWHSALTTKYDDPSTEERRLIDWTKIPNENGNLIGLSP